jgi:hypothetical protein
MVARIKAETLEIHDYQILAKNLVELSVQHLVLVRVKIRVGTLAPLPSLNLASLALIDTLVLMRMTLLLKRLHRVEGVYDIHGAPRESNDTFVRLDITLWLQKQSSLRYLEADVELRDRAESLSRAMTNLQVLCGDINVDRDNTVQLRRLFPKLRWLYTPENEYGIFIPDAAG